MPAKIIAIAGYLPERVVTNDDLAQAHPEWEMNKTVAKTGIRSRHCASEDEWSSDLAIRAVQKLLAEHPSARERIDFILCCTQTPDHLLPSMACRIQHECGFGTHLAALDINMGCSGYVYGLTLASALVNSHQASGVLLVTADVYTKLLKPNDRNTHSIFGDAATATLIVCSEVATEPGLLIGATVTGTDGGGYHSLVAQGSAMKPAEGDQGLFMNGPEVFAFTLNRVPGLVSRLLDRVGMTLDEVSLVVPHQANAFMLESLRSTLGIPPDKFVVSMHETGNTVSSSIPLALLSSGFPFAQGDVCSVLLIGFGVGFSWAGTLLTQDPS